MFTPDQLDAFHTKGFVRLPGAVPDEAIRDMRDRLWALLQAKGALRDDAATWRAGAGVRLHAIRRGDPDPKASPLVRAALDAVFDGTDWRLKDHWGQALVTFPNAEDWAVPRSIWHVDHAYRQSERISGVNVFLFVDDMAAGGGGTCVVESSPRLIARFMSTVPASEPLTQTELASRFFQSHAWLQELKGKPQRSDRNERLLRDTEVDGIPVRVVEFTGQAGDAVLCHPWLVHAANAPNASNRPRLMRASRVYRKRRSLSAS